MTNNGKISTLMIVIALFCTTGCSSIQGSSNNFKSNQQTVEWKKISDVAQYKGADWKNEVKRKSNLTLEEAKSIAASDPNITFFFYMKNGRMYLEGKTGPNGWSDKGVFRAGDAVFFTGKPWYGSAPGFSDAYEKE
jgi:hypothetical protein